MAKFHLEDTPASLAETLLTSPGRWFIIGTAQRGDNQTMRTFAYRLKAGRHQGFNAAAIRASASGRWEATVRTDGRESVMYARWCPSAEMS